MRVMTYNIQDGGAQRADLIADVIAQANPGVALLNEADDPDIVASLAGQLGLHHVWAPGSGDKHIALLTRLPILDWQIYNRRPLTQAVLVVTLPAATLYCVHLVPYFMLLPYELARWRTVRAMLHLARRDARAPQLILGDFNAVTRGEQADTSLFPPKRQRQLRLQLNRQPRFALAPVRRAGFVDCYRNMHPQRPGLTWMTTCPSARLDYVFADPDLALRLLACDVFTLPPSERASDHYPLVADFAL